LQQLLLGHLAFGKKRLLLARGSEDPLARQGNPQGHATHFAQTQNDAALRVGLHNAFHDFARLICGAILEKSHLYLKLPFNGALV
jgi:hypothetical protein